MRALSPFEIVAVAASDVILLAVITSAMFARPRGDAKLLSDAQWKRKRSLRNAIVMGFWGWFLHKTASLSFLTSGEVFFFFGGIPLLGFPWFLLHESELKSDLKTSTTPLSLSFYGYACVGTFCALLMMVPTFPLVKAAAFIWNSIGLPDVSRGWSPSVNE
jgi:hypothetical protein